MTRVTQGARQRHFILWLGFRVNVVNLNHSVRYESLIRETRVHPSQLYMLISGFITYSQHGIHRASAHYRRRLTQYRATAIALIKTQTNIIF